MIISDLKKIKLPDTPGVYIFRGSRKEVLYVGKATSLRSRVKSYFVENISEVRSPLIALLVDKASTVTYEKTDSVLEALILESILIKKYQPQYNTKEKDDKSFQYVLITDELYPRVLMVRGRDLLNGKRKKIGLIKNEYGPFPAGGALRVGLSIIRKIFPFRDMCTPQSDKVCFNSQIGLCPGVCGGLISSKEYKKNIRHINLFFKGKKGELLTRLKKQMNVYSKLLEFEKAQNIKRQIYSLKHINDVAMIKRSVAGTKENIRIEGYDIAHLSGQYVVGVMTVVTNGEVEKNEYRKFKIKSFDGADDTRALNEVLERRFKHEDWTKPDLIVLDGGKAQLNVGLKAGKLHGVKVVSVVKDSHHKPKGILGDGIMMKKFKQDILLVNAESHRFAIKYHRSLRDKI